MLKLFACAVSACLAFALQNAEAAETSQTVPAKRLVDFKASDGVVLKGSYFSAGKPGPGVLLFHQSNRTRKSWDGVAQQLAASGINTLTIDMRGTGDSGGVYDKWAKPKPKHPKWPADIENAWRFLLSQPGVDQNTIGVGGAGLDGVDNSIQIARRHSAQVKSLVLLSGETFKDGLDFLRDARQLPELFVVDDEDEYPPTVEAMELLYITASSPAKKFVHYVAPREGLWKWYEPYDVGRVPAKGHHGVDMFERHRELPSLIVDWLKTTLMVTPGRAPADTLASAAILNDIRTPGGIKRATQRLMDARRKDPKAQLWPEISLSIIAQDHLRAGEPKAAVETFKLNLLAYADSADATDSLATAYLAAGQKTLARNFAEKTLSLLDSHAAPASSWTDTPEYRGEIRRDAKRILDALDKK